MVDSRVESELMMVSSGLIADKVPYGKLPWKPVIMVYILANDRGCVENPPLAGLYTY